MVCTYKLKIITGKFFYYYMFRLTGFIVLLLLSGQFIMGQDVGFSRLSSYDVFLNPALTGSKEYSRVHLHYRNQWPTIESKFLTYNASVDIPLQSINSGVGVMFMHDMQGSDAVTRTSFDLLYSFGFEVSRELEVRLGLKASGIQKKVDPTGFIFPDMLNPSTGIGETTQETLNQYSDFFMDFSTGISVTYDLYFAGIGVEHLTEPIENYEQRNLPVESRLSRKYTFYGGMEIPFYERRSRNPVYTMIPMVIYQQQGAFKQINAGFTLAREPVFFGAFFRHSMDHLENVSPFIGFSNQILLITYTYDLTVSNNTFSKPFSGAHEVGLQINIDHSVKGGKKRFKTIKRRRF